MEPIVSIPDGTGVSDDGDMRLVKVEFESGGDAIDSIETFDRVEWLQSTGDDDVWRMLAEQQVGDQDVSDEDGKRVAVAEIYGWWVDSEREDADYTDNTWYDAIGSVYGKTLVPAVVDYEWSRDRAAWSFPTVHDEDGGWVSPGKYGLGGPKSVIPVIFPVGEPRQIDAAPVRRRKAKKAAFDNDLDAKFDWETAYHEARDRLEARQSMYDEELDISAMKTLEDQHNHAHKVASKAFLTFVNGLKDELGTDVDPVTMTHANEAIAEAIRDLKDLDDPRDDPEWDQ